jgi:site-specific DNA-methyltransferase (adenine-specific)
MAKKRRVRKLECFRCRCWPCTCPDRCTIIHGDARKLFAEIIPKRTAVLVTDPPYGVVQRVTKSTYGRGKYRMPGNGDHTARDRILEQWGNRPAIVFGCWRDPIQHAKAVLVWDKGPAFGMGDLRMPWKPNWELIFILGRGFRGKRTTGVLLGYPAPNPASKARMHPTIKPASLLRELIAKCPPGVIIDPFCGSGSTLVAARQLKRRAIGIEIERKYCQICAQRLHGATHLAN